MKTNIIIAGILLLVMLSGFVTSVFAQIEQFEVEVEQLANPEEPCSRKVISSKGAVVPFTLKVFYDFTTQRSHELKQILKTFPIVQQTNQVLIFHTNYTDQYQLNIDLNYEIAKERQIYVQALSNGADAYSEQEKFSGKRFCTTYYINTIEPEKIPTREELFGDLYYAIAQIPALVEASNRNTITFSSAIQIQWFLIVVILIAVLVVVATLLVFFSKMKGSVDSFQDMVDSARDFLSSDDSNSLRGQLNSIDTSMERVQNMLALQTKEFEKEKKSFLSQISEMPKKQMSKLYKTLLESRDPLSTLKLNWIREQRKEKKNITNNEDDQQLEEPINVEFEEETPEEESNKSEVAIWEKEPDDLELVMPLLDEDSNTANFTEIPHEIIINAYNKLLDIPRQEQTEQQIMMHQLLHKELTKRAKQ